MVDWRELFVSLREKRRGIYSMKISKIESDQSRKNKCTTDEQVFICTVYAT